MGQPHRIDDEAARRVAEQRAAFSELLLTARGRAGLSLDQVASVTKVPARHLDALEQGRVGELPRGVYRRGILRTYASAVGLEPSLVLERFGHAFGLDAAFSEWETVPLPARVRRDVPVRSAAGLGEAEPVTRISPRHGPAPVRRDHVIIGARRHRAGVIIAGLLLAALLAYPLFSRYASTSVLEAPAAPTGPGAIREAAAATIVPAVHDTSATSGGAIGTRREDAVASQLEPERQDTALPAASELVVTSNPAGARVTVDGIGWGVTPITIRHLPPGVKRLRLTLDGHISQERDVRIGDDGGRVSARITLPPRN